MKHILILFLSMTLFLLGCEDGPEQVFTPLDGAGEVEHSTGNTWTPEGDKPYESRSGGDAVGRALFCDEDVAEAQIQEMVVAPIIPDDSAGGIKLLDEDGKPYVADVLIGSPDEGKLCDPTGTYADAFVWGPTQEVIALFDTETRLLEAVIAYQSYLGAMTGSVTIDGAETPIVIQPRQRITIDGQELLDYAGSDERNTNPNSFLNEANVTKMYGMVRETFFDDPPLDPDFNCLDAKRCRIVYTAPNQEATPQDSFIIFEDSGVQLRMTPDGYVIFVYLTPVRRAPFEIETEVDLGDDLFKPVLTSFSQDGCVIDLSAETTWAEFRDRCVPEDSAAFNRISYNVHTQRDAVTAEFDGISLDFMRKVSENGILGDGEMPGDSDILYEMTWTLSMAAPISNYIPSRLARGYRSRLSRRLRDSLHPDTPDDHPLKNYRVDIPQTLQDQNDPFPLDVIAVDPANGDTTNWIRDIVEDVTDIYQGLTPEQRQYVDERIGQPIYLVEPFVESALDQLTGGATAAEDALVRLRSTDDQNWAIGYGHFVQDGVPFRIIAQFSNSYGAITAVTISRGASEVDAIFDGINRSVRNRTDAADYPYYQLELSKGDPEINPYALGGTGLTVTEFDRQLDTVKVNLKTVSLSGAIGRTTIVVPGDPIEDRNGYTRPTGGERFEFVPASLVRLLGKETLLDFWVDAQGQVGSVAEYSFKGKVKLCDGPLVTPPLDPEAPEDAPPPEPVDTSLFIEYGDNMPQTMETWRTLVGDATYRDCQILFNYSSDGHVLDSVFSLKSKTSFVTIADRAVTARIWK